MTKTLFCAHCQADKEQVFELVGGESPEFQATCPDCTRVVKFPPRTDEAELKALFDKHKADNQGQVRVELVPDPSEHPAMKALAKV